jgi:hypothetical protein
VALSNEAVGLSNIVASRSGVNSIAGVGKAGRGNLASGTAVGTAEGRGAVASDRGAANRRGDARSTVQARVVGLVGSGNSSTAGGLKGVAEGASKAGVAGALPVVLSQRNNIPSRAGSASGVAGVGVARIRGASTEAVIGGRNNAAAGSGRSGASGVHVCAVVGYGNTRGIGVIAGSKHVVAREPGADVGLEVGQATGRQSGLTSSIAGSPVGNTGISAALRGNGQDKSGRSGGDTL